MAIPSLPLFDGDNRADLIGAMVDCVEPAVERLVAAGIARRDDIHLIGQSMGGCPTSGARISRTPTRSAGR